MRGEEGEGGRGEEGRRRGGESADEVKDAFIVQFMISFASLLSTKKKPDAQPVRVPSAMSRFPTPAAIAEG